MARTMKDLKALIAHAEQCLVRVRETADAIEQLRTTRDSTIIYTTVLDVTVHLDIVLARTLVLSRHKAHEEAYFKACNELGITPESTRDLKLHLNITGIS